MVAKIEPVDDAVRTGDGILLNCHFDSKPGSPGATDNMISCSVLLYLFKHMHFINVKYLLASIVQGNAGNYPSDLFSTRVNHQEYDRVSIQWS